jgi:hypothetical protein
MLGIAIALALVCLMGVRTQRRRWSAVFAALLLTILLTSDGCGGGGSGGQLSNPGTPMGSYNITVTVSSGGIQATSNVQVEVN